MNTLLEFEFEIRALEDFTNKLARKIKKGDIFLLSGDLGVGKTTFARKLIFSIFDMHDLKKPEKIQSPSFPILINYPILNFELNHYDLFRLKDKGELEELNIYENLNNNISIIEWPEIILENNKLTNYYLLEFKLISLKKRFIKMKHFQKNFNDS